MIVKDTPLVIGDKKIKNRFFLGTGKFKSKADMKRSIIDSKIQVVTVAMRRVDVDRHPENILEYIPEDTILMVNTSGARNAKEAVRIARLAREASGTNWIKIEVINDSKYLLPDNYETIKATETLVSEGFVVLPYMYPDLYVARELQKVGAAAIMPLGSLIGSGQGLKARRFIEIMIEEIDTPIIVDAGIGKPSQAAGDPASMARAFSLAVEAGRMAYLAQLSEEKDLASASSPLTGFLFDETK